MAEIVLADDGVAFDGRRLRDAPLGGAETAVVGLGEALAARGHKVSVYNGVAAPLDYRGVVWRPLAEGLPAHADLYIANRGSRLIDALPGAGAQVFWIHNPAGYLLKWRYLWRLVKVQPTIVFSGAYHAASYPAWAPSGGRAIVPYGISDIFLTAAPANEAPGPRAIFTSNPRRGLDWLLDLWVRQIRPQVPSAELHLYCGVATYGGHDGARIDKALALARAGKDAGVVLHEPVAKSALVSALAGARALLYRGDPGETFCLAVGEAQALGVPAVVQPLGSTAERVVDGETGFVAVDAETFVMRAVQLLTDDGL
ncbi:MAG: glycosyltransferase, partial [Kiloniellales bacterium]